MGYRAAEPISGFLTYNEGFYMNAAERLAHQSITAALLTPPDAVSPPLYPFLLSLVFRVTGPVVVIARWFTISLALGAVVYLFLLGSLLYNRRIGLLAAAIYAFMPAFIVVGRNIQIDALLILLVVAGTYHYLRGVKEAKGWQPVVAGLLLGLGTLTKHVALLAPAGLALWETIDARGPSWLRERRVRGFLLAFVPLALVWWVFRLVGDAAGFLPVQSTYAGRLGIPGLGELLPLAREAFWMMGPPAAIIVVAAVVFLLRRRQRADVLVLCMFGVYATFYVVYHFHTYYLAPALPFAALACGRTLDAALHRRRALEATAVAALVLSLMLCSAVQLSGMKWGHWSTAGLEKLLPGDPSKYTVVLDPSVEQASRPAVDFYARRTYVVNASAGVRNPPKPGTTVVYFAPWIDVPHPIATAYGQDVSVVAFGVGIDQIPGNDNMFTNGPWRLEWVGPLWRFGTVSKRIPVATLQPASAAR